MLTTHSVFTHPHIDTFRTHSVFTHSHIDTLRTHSVFTHMLTCLEHIACSHTHVDTFRTAHTVDHTCLPDTHVHVFVHCADIHVDTMYLHTQAPSWNTCTHSPEG